jgi:hypothetical protein
MSKFKSGNSGRPKGAIGKTTKEARELYLNAIQGESEHIAQAFKDLREKDPYKYLQVIAKFTQFIIPKLSNTVLSNEEDEVFKPFTINIGSDTDS